MLLLVLLAREVIGPEFALEENENPIPASGAVKMRNTSRVLDSKGVQSKT